MKINQDTLDHILTLGAWSADVSYPDVELLAREVVILRAVADHLYEVYEHLGEEEKAALDCYNEEYNPPFKNPDGN